jgi:hypothetical protein
VRLHQCQFFGPRFALGEGFEQRGEPGALDLALDARQPYR